MQFYMNGFQVGDPEIQPADSGNTWTPQLPECVDVLVVGSGPAGLMLTAQLSTEASFVTRLIERRDGPLEIGQADGVSARSIELLHTFGIGEKLIREAYWINETAFWGPDETDSNIIARSGRVQDTADDSSEFPHVVVNQARLQAYLLEYMKKSATRLEPNYGLELSDLHVSDSGDYPVVATLNEVLTGVETVIRAKYVVGCDGARSAVRSAIGRELKGESANHAWGVLDVLARTDFPDVRLKSIIQSAEHGNILLIPREGDYLFRIYVDLGEVDPNQRSGVRSLAQDDVIARAQKVLHPYSLDVKSVVWFSIYEVGQRVTDGFDDVPSELRDSRLPRVFIAGDACHTHSAKAGQGMNVSMPDANNLAWKLISVLRGRAVPELLHTYSAERQPIAQGLIDFDKEWSGMMAGLHNEHSPLPQVVTPQNLQEYYVKTRPYTTGVATRYKPTTVLTTEDLHQHLATGYPVGKRFHSAPVIRLADAKRVQLGHVHKPDGAFRLYAFCDRSGTHFSDLMTFLADSPQSPLRLFTPAGADADSVIEVLGIYPGHHRDLHIDDQPAVLTPTQGIFGLTDVFKVFTTDHKTGPDIFDLRGISRDEGAMILVRPDQYVAAVLPLTRGPELTAYFDRIYKRLA
ncbi:MAG: 3-hydroxybenzoate 4-monooxygenase [Actinobacteria bacterium]|uniref:Unannotated protein n=1 Tax=freshwater metagenome TaxID=449393 RepID=A0A6J7FGK1_9ZZZZ|nr:3-hydroxybenzoate 4-monooxygenase [Actinomycetota bacterium]